MLSRKANLLNLSNRPQDVALTAKPNGVRKQLGLIWNHMTKFSDEVMESRQQDNKMPNRPQSTRRGARNQLRANLAFAMQFNNASQHHHRRTSTRAISKNRSCECQSFVTQASKSLPKQLFQLLFQLRHTCRLVRPRTPALPG